MGSDIFPSSRFEPRRQKRRSAESDENSADSPAQGRCRRFRAGVLRGGERDTPGILLCLALGVGVASIAWDIAGRLRTARGLRKSEELFHKVFEDAPFGMSVSGPDRRFMQVNAAFCRMVGYSEQELLGLGWGDLTHPGDVGPSSRQTAEPLRRDPEGRAEVEQRYIHRNGAVVWMRSRVSVVRDSRGSPRCQLVFEAAKLLAAQGKRAAVVSMPCWELFEAQPADYRAVVLGTAPRVGVEAAIRFGWDRWLGETSAFVGMTGFGASAPAEALYEHFGITPRAVADAAVGVISLE